MKSNVALIGFMGTGKTAVGKALAKKLGKEFIEMDSLIEQKAGKSIPEIFGEDGEIAFRELEIATAKEISKQKNLVIACGGGVVLNKINIDRLKNEAVIVYLTASPEVILKRVSNSEARPLLNVANKISQISELLQFRKPYYEQIADISINTSEFDIASVMEQIISRLKEVEGFRF